MKKIIPTLIIFISIGFPKAPDWGVNPWDFKFTATHTCVLFVDGDESIDEFDIIGAFVDGECRGIAMPTFFPMPGNERYTINMMLYSNLSYGEFITFKAYDASSDIVLDVQNYEIEFIENENYGDDIKVKKLYCITNKNFTKTEFSQSQLISTISVKVRLDSSSKFKDGSNIPITSFDNGNFIISALENNISVLVEDEQGNTPYILQLKLGKIYLKTTQ